MQLGDLVWTFVSLVLTLMVFSYLLGDNPLFRIASYLFVGVSAGYVAVLVIYQVLLPRLIWPLMQGNLAEKSLLLIPLVLSALLLTKLSPKLSQLGSLPMGYLVGVGAAVAVGGAVMGTLVNQMLATINIFDLSAVNLSVNPAFQFFEGVIILFGTLATLSYFQFSVKRKEDGKSERLPIVEALAKIGRVFIAITFGALFAGVFAASITALIDRLDFLINVIKNIFLS